MLVYEHINLLTMHSRFASKEVVQLATDSIYIRKSALKKLQWVATFVAKKSAAAGETCAVPVCSGGVSSFGRTSPMG